MQRNMWDRKEDALNRRLEALAAREDWEGVLRELDQYDANNERRHQEHRDDFDLALLDGRSCEDEPYQIPRRLCLFQEEAGWTSSSPSGRRICRSWYRNIHSAQLCGS